MKRLLSRRKKLFAKLTKIILRIKNGLRINSILGLSPKLRAEIDSRKNTKFPAKVSFFWLNIISRKLKAQRSFVRNTFYHFFTFLNQFFYSLPNIFFISINSEEICSGSLNVTMCPLCDQLCDYWPLSQTCMHVKVTYLFDNPATVFFAVFMSFWGVYKKIELIKFRIKMANFSHLHCSGFIPRTMETIFV